MSERPVVVYVAGSGRSGSTLLERLLARVDGVVEVGELVDLFRRVAPADERCGCGEPFSRCGFWTDVGERAFGGWDPALVADTRALTARLARQRHVPALLTAGVLADRRARADLRTYGDRYARLYRAVLDVSGARVVVDASKWAAQALAVSRSGAVDLRLLHLVRDARGVAFSWAKAGVERPHAAGSVMVMASSRSAGTAARWTALQGQIGLSRNRFGASTRVRYEDLVADPHGTCGRALHELGLDRVPAALAALVPDADGRVDLPAGHGLSGNPSRFRTGPQALRADEQWRRDLARRDRLAVTLLAGPALARYGYLDAPLAPTRRRTA